MARIGRVRVSRPDAVRRTSPPPIRLDWTVLKVRHRSFPTSSGLRGSSTWVGRTRPDERNAKGPQESEMRGRDTRARQSATATGTSVTAVISIIGVAVPIALIVPITIRLAMRVVTAVASVRANHTGRQSKDTCDHDVASHTIEGIQGLSPRGQRSG